MHVECYVRICKYGFCYFMLTMSVVNASIFMLCHTLFVVHVVKSAISATNMQTVSSQYVFFKDDETDLTT